MGESVMYRGNTETGLRVKVQEQALNFQQMFIEARMFTMRCSTTKLFAMTQLKNTENEMKKEGRQLRTVLMRRKKAQCFTPYTSEHLRHVQVIFAEHRSPLHRMFIHLIPEQSLLPKLSRIFFYDFSLNIFPIRARYCVGSKLLSHILHRKREVIVNAMRQGDDLTDTSQGMLILPTQTPLLFQTIYACSTSRSNDLLK